MPPYFYTRRQLAEMFTHVRTYCYTHVPLYEHIILDVCYTNQYLVFAADLHLGTGKFVRLLNIILHHGKCY